MKKKVVIICAVCLSVLLLCAPFASANTPVIGGGLLLTSLDGGTDSPNVAYSSSGNYYTFYNSAYTSLGNVAKGKFSFYFSPSLQSQYLRFEITLSFTSSTTAYPDDTFNFQLSGSSGTLLNVVSPWDNGATQTYTFSDATQTTLYSFTVDFSGTFASGTTFTCKVGMFDQNNNSIIESYLYDITTYDPGSFGDPSDWTLDNLNSWNHIDWDDYNGLFSDFNSHFTTLINYVAAPITAMSSFVTAFFNNVSGVPLYIASGFFSAICISLLIVLLRRAI